MTPSKDRQSEIKSGSDDSSDRTVLEPVSPLLGRSRRPDGDADHTMIEPVPVDDPGDGDRTVLALPLEENGGDRTVLALSPEGDDEDRTVLAPAHRTAPASAGPSPARAARFDRPPRTAEPVAPPPATEDEDEDRTVDLTPVKRRPPADESDETVSNLKVSPSAAEIRAPRRTEMSTRASTRVGATIGSDWSGDRSPEEIPPIEPGTLLGHTFEIERVAARGGMGEVFRARHIDLGTTHAIKVILPELVRDAVLIDLFRREASVLRQVRHDAVVAYDGVNRDELGRMFLVMEFVDGPSLTKVLEERTLSPDEAIELLDRVASGLAAAHEKGVVHRDMSPDNIILSGGRIDHAKIIDFGIAKQAAANSATIVGQGFAGRYAYASPEQIGMFEGRVDARSDIYSLALVIIAALFGQPLDMGDTPSAMLRRRSGVPDLSAIPEPLRSVLSWMLQPDPNDRPASMSEVIGAARSREEASAKTFAAENVERKRLPVPLLAAAGAAVLIGGAAAAWLFMSPGTPPPAEKPVAKVETPAPAFQPAPPPEKPVAKVETPVPVEKPLTLDALRGELDGARETFRCSGLRVENDDGRPLLNGYTSSAADTETLRGVVDRLRLPAPAKFNVATEPPLLCQAMEAAGIADGQALAGDALRVELNKNSGDYVDGDVMRVTINTAARAGYLNVDYFDPGDNSVVHMIPMPLRQDGRVGKNMTLVVGGDPKTSDAKTRVYGISAPFGPGLILAVLTPKQLFPSDRAERDADGMDYIGRLRTALGRLDAGEASARAVHFTTRPK